MGEQSEADKKADEFRRGWTTGRKGLVLGIVLTLLVVGTGLAQTYYSKVSADLALEAFERDKKQDPADDSPKTPPGDVPDERGAPDQPPTAERPMIADYRLALIQGLSAAVGFVVLYFYLRRKSLSALTAISAAYKSERDELRTAAEQAERTRVGLADSLAKMTKECNDATTALGNAPRLEVSKTTKYFSGVRVRIAELVVGSIIDGVTFEDCTLIGPAVFSASGTTLIVDSTIRTYNNDLRTVAIQMPLDARVRPLAGVIFLKDCTIRRCETLHISILQFGDDAMKAFLETPQQKPPIGPRRPQSDGR